MKSGIWFVIASALVGCTGKTSLGALEEGSGSGSESGGFDTSSGDGGGATGGTSGTGDSSSSGGPVTSGNPSETGDTGEVVSCIEPDTDPGCLPQAPPCGETCGQAQSQFDPNGCVRLGCGNDDGCGDGQRCFVGLDFGLCEGSGLVCQVDQGSQTCGCSSDPDCNGGHCIPEELYPIASPGPTGAMYVNDDCGPDDGPLTVFRWLAQDADPGCELVLAPPVELVLAFDGVLAPGVYAFGDLEAAGAGTGTYVPNGNGSELPVASATVTVDSVDGDLVSGSYTASLIGPDGFLVLTGEFGDTPFCETNPVCG